MRWWVLDVYNINVGNYTLFMAVKILFFFMRLLYNWDIDFLFLCK